MLYFLKADPYVPILGQVAVLKSAFQQVLHFRLANFSNFGLGLKDQFDHQNYFFNFGQVRPGSTGSAAGTGFVTIGTAGIVGCICFLGIKSFA